MIKTLAHKVLAVFVLSGLLMSAATFPITFAAKDQNNHVVDQNELNESRSSSSSLNWAGYTAQGGNYTSVTGTWIIPMINDTRPNHADAAWVGIGGVQTRDLIQAGTQSIVTDDGSVSYQAWYELLPDVSTPTDLEVSPGNAVTASITETSPDVWHITIKNNTTGKAFEKTVRYHSSHR